MSGAAQFTLAAPPEASGERIDRFLSRLAAERAHALHGLSRARLQKLIGDGAVTVNGAPARAAYKLRAGDRLAVHVPPPQPLDLTPEARPLDVLYEDEHLVVVNKPAGLAVHPGAGRRTGTLVHALLAHCRDLSGIGGVERPGIVHRLDRDTSGVLVVAKNDVAHLALSRAFAARQVEKRYVAFVFGTPSPSQAVIDTAYGRHPTQRTRFTARVKTGRRAVTEYRVAETGGGVSRLEVLLGTGRTHQIRVHLAERGHPIVGDALYGGKRWASITDPALRAMASTLDRQALHAASLALRHPVTGETLRLAAPLPPDLQALATALARTKT